MRRFAIIKRHRLFFLALMTQVLFLGMMLYKSMAPRSVYTFEEKRIESTGNFYLNSGAYRILVDYKAIPTEETDRGDSSKMVGKCSLISAEHDSAMTDCEIGLDAGHETAEAYVWVKQASRLSDAHFEVIAGEDGTAHVTSIVMEEQLRYRAVRFGGWLLLFGMLDAVILLLFFERPFGLKEKDKYLLAGLLGICIAVNLPLMTNHLYNGHDMVYHLERISAMAEELKNGQFPVRVETGLLNGYSYISSLMYGNLFLYLPALLTACMVPLQDAYKIYLALINCGTCLLAYWSLKKMTKRRDMALSGTFVYTFSAYRLVNVYVRSAVGEYTAMLFLPVVIAGFYNILSGARRKYGLRDYLPIVLGVTGILESHVISTQLTAVFVLGACVLCIRRVLQKERFFALVKALCLTVLLNAWYLVPFVEYYGEKLAFNTYSIRNIQMRGAYLPQIFDVFINALGGNVDNATQYEMGMGIGIALTAGLILLLLYRIGNGRFKGETEKETGVFCFLGCLAIVLSTTWFPWDRIRNYSGMLARLLCNIQFPWRYLSLASALLMVSLVFTLGLIGRKYGERVAQKIAVVIAAAVILPTGLFMNGYINETEEVSYYSTNEIGDFHIGAGEYTMSGEDVDLLTRADVLAEDGIVVENYCNNDGTIQLTCHNTGDGENGVTIPLIAYKNYRAVDEASGAEFALTQGENVRLRILIPEGYVGTIRVEFAIPWYWRLSEMVTLLTAVAILGNLWQMKRKAKKELREIE